jgi:type VI secretion system protein ImpI
MSLTLEIVTGNPRDLGARRTMIFGQDGGTIGRSLDADWPLPDGKRYLSGRHASIDFRSGSYYIVDMSRNGVFVNGANEPVGRGKPQRLFPGDRIRIGEYEMLVSIENVDDTRESLIGVSHIDPVDIRQRVDSPEPTGYDLLEPEVITGVGLDIRIEDDDLGIDFGLVPDAADGTDTLTVTGTDAADPPRSGVTNISERLSPAAVSLETFFRAAGIEAPTLNAKQSEQLLTRLGQVTRALISGTIESLHIRSIQQAELRQADHAPAARASNRLQSAANYHDGFTRLLLDDSAEYLSPTDSVRAAFADLTAHQRTLLAALRSALDEYLERLDPQVIERSIGGGRIGALMAATAKHRYWDIYKDVYAVLGNRRTDELPEAFVEEVAKAYERLRALAEAEAESAAKLMAG